MRKLLLGAAALLAFGLTTIVPAQAGGGDRAHVAHKRHAVAHKHHHRCHHAHRRAQVAGYYGWVAQPVTRVYYVPSTVYRPVYAYSAWSYPHQGYYRLPSYHRAHWWHHRHW